MSAEEFVIISSPLAPSGSALSEELKHHDLRIRQVVANHGQSVAWCNYRRINQFFGGVLSRLLKKLEAAHCPKLMLGFRLCSSGTCPAVLGCEWLARCEAPLKSALSMG